MKEPFATEADESPFVIMKHEGIRYAVVNGFIVSCIQVVFQGHKHDVAGGEKILCLGQLVIEAYKCRNRTVEASTVVGH